MTMTVTSSHSHEDIFLSALHHGVSGLDFIPIRPVLRLQNPALGMIPAHRRVSFGP